MATDHPKTTIAVLSIGDMGGGIARLLVAKGFRVVTDVTGRSADTISRAQSAGVEILPLSTIVSEASAILSIVPPSDAKSTAEAVLSSTLSALDSGTRDPTSEPLIFIDLNATSPSSARSLASSFSPHESKIQFIDGAIIGGPPTLSLSPDAAWYIPQIPTSGPFPVSASLASALQAYHIDSKIGSASGLKMCFASLTKGYTAIAIQAFTTAHRLGVLDHLNSALEQTVPGLRGRLEKGVTGMPPKAYRWVREMEEISATHRDEGGFGEVGADIFTGAARVYGLVADGTVLGEEKVGRRKRGTTVEDVALAVGEGLEVLEGRGKRRRVEGGEGEQDGERVAEVEQR
ncbi:6-phosphogluconate dehydrogenase [Coniochaeta ligniaria NRRL 30616]|uniref:6-phosphogluconate dehydrogenase n=1 Tax=Coniochaeta ligniaria NRRL 30616 TaxID=1408157 RepID=A0A1J7K3V3_9PEZI|nr:6-phosphogluconate dehydrogenase [Coniochaeta ligniaria NRRL 30616]